MRILSSSLSGLAAVIFISSSLFAQTPVYDDFIGAGHSEGIVVSSSSSLEQPGWNRNATGMRTMDGGGMDAAEMEASRFLAQAGFGGNQAEIEQLASSLDFEGWIDWQSKLELYSMLDRSEQAWNTAKEISMQPGQNGQSMPWHTRHFQAALWQSAINEPDVLRNRIAMALNEVFVISNFSNIGAGGDSYASYYDVLRRNALGNFKHLLLEVSLHPAMGVYLTHFRNSKADAAANTFPDENFAREIMQLFTIGLYELNPDGSPKIDAQGNWIAAYNQNDVRELAKVFTGLGAGGINQAGIEAGRGVDFSASRTILSYTHPMKMYEDKHEQGSKSFLGQTVNTGTGMQDIERAIDILYKHDNTAPFFCKKLIQLLVTSNPSPQYIEDVATVFVANEDGVRGDMLSVVKAILLHDEARTCESQLRQGHGKLRAPALRYLHLAKALDINSYSGLTWPNHNTFSNATGHFTFTSPSVFNYYLPDYQPNGPVADLGLVAPEYEVHNASTSIGYINELDDWTRNGKLYKSSDLPEFATINYGAYLPQSTDPEVLLNHLDMMFTHGRLSDGTRAAIKAALKAYNPNSGTAVPSKDRLDLAVYLLLMSPDYNVLK